MATGHLTPAKNDSCVEIAKAFSRAKADTTEALQANGKYMSILNPCVDIFKKAKENCLFCWKEFVKGSGAWKHMRYSKCSSLQAVVFQFKEMEAEGEKEEGIKYGIAQEFLESASGKTDWTKQHSERIQNAALEKEGHIK